MEWSTVSTREELDDFLTVVGSFHDGILKEIHWVNRQFVDASLSMQAYRLSDVRMLVQRQWADLSAVEMRFEGVWKFTVDSVGWIDGAIARTELSSAMLGPPRELLVLDFEDSVISFESMKWRDASEWIGVPSRFGPFPEHEPDEPIGAKEGVIKPLDPHSSTGTSRS
ncbi:hypothetical protein EON81_21655 [bacterium]|nr:MAG: hypothetical protein EON81_21655 [bacterium]